MRVATADFWTPNTFFYDSDFSTFSAITFVALGTSLPDTFASKTAAVAERTADNAIGNVTGSNSVNVFLGLGLPWMIASIYHAAKVSLCN